MEEAVEAAATVIKYIGAAIIDEKCLDLVAEARGAEEAADAVGVPGADLNRAARQLEESGKAERITAVVCLRNASAALEGEARTRLNALHGAAAKRERLCLEYRECLEGMLEMDRTKQEPAGGTEEEDAADRRAATPWWRWVWGRLLRRERGDIEEGHVATNDLALTAKVLGEGSPKLEKKRRARLLAQSRHVLAAVIGADVLSNDLDVATDALDRAGDDMAARLECVVALETAATALEAAGCAALDALRDRAGNLSCACRELKEAADAMARVQRAAAEQRERRLAGAWWLCLLGSPRRCGEQREEGQEVLEDGAATGRGQGKDKNTAMASLALYGSLTLMTYLGPETVAERVKNLSETFRLWFHSGLCLWWTLQAAGVPCSTYAQSLREKRCVQILCHLGTLAVNGFVVVFVYLALGVHNKVALGFWLTSASLIHLASFALAFRRGDLSR